MFLDARQVPEGTVVETDICIVGAGAAGITLARDLRSDGFRVVVLESGDLEGDQRTQALYAGENIGVRNHDLDISRLRFFGGTTNHWAGWCRPLDPIDFEARDGIPLSGWPIARSDLDPYYPKAQQICALAPQSFDDVDHWSKVASLPALAFTGERLRTGVFQVSAPIRFGETFGEELRKAENVSVYLNANATEIETDTAASNVSRIRIACLDGRRFVVTARLFVLAAGGMENARLLLLSTRNQPAGLGNGNDVVGRYFMDHPWLGHAATLRFAAPDRNLGFYYPDIEVGELKFFGSILPAASLLRREPIGNFRVVMQPVRRIAEGIESLRTLKENLGSGSIPDELGYHIARIVEDLDEIAAATYKTVVGSRTAPFSTSPATGPYVGTKIDVNIEQAPNARSRLILSSRRDELGQRRLALDWRLGEVEKRTFNRAIELVASELGRLGVGRVRYAPLVDATNWPIGLDGSRHHLGTTRMSADPKADVVDPSCKVHGISNLYIAGSSVFPTSGSANPTLTIVAMALRLGNELRRRMA